MANEQIPSELKNSQLNSPPSSPIDPAKAYESHAPMLYRLLRAFQPEAQAQETIKKIAEDMYTALPDSGYRRYSHYIVYHLAFQRLEALFAEEGAPALPLKAISFGEYFALVARDLFQFSCRDIAAIQGVSEGSVRTRLDRARQKTFATDEKPRLKSTATLASAAGENHICLQIKEKIEDWDLKTARLGQFTAPSTLTALAGACPKCLSALRNRLTSLSYFSELPIHEIPAKLIEFPVTTLFMKKKNKIHFNWSAAPWYLKALFEGLLATSLVLGIVLSIPRIKNAYEFWQERRVDLYSLAELASGFNSQDPHTEIGTSGSSTVPTTAESGTSAPGAPLNRADGVALPPIMSAQNFVGPLPKGAKEKLLVQPESEFRGRNSDVIGPDQVLRVLIKSDSPEGLRDQIVQLLQQAQYAPANSSSAIGAALPGGIMFDIFVPTANYKTLYNSLIGLGLEQPKFILTRNKERGVAGKARIKIWLQRI